MIYNFYWVLDNEIAGMALPTALQSYGLIEGGDTSLQDEMVVEVKFLKANGIGGVVTLTEDSIATPFLHEQEIHHLHLPVPDMTAPTLSQIREFVNFVQESTVKGSAVVVHCMAGAGRTGTMIACYLVSKGYTPLDAVTLVRTRRPGAIETRDQEACIVDYSARLVANDFEN